MGLVKIADFDPVQSLQSTAEVTVGVELPEGVDAIAVPIRAGSPAPDSLGLDADALAAAGFAGKRGQTLVVPGSGGPVQVAVGLGSPETVDATLVRDAAASFARAVPQHTALAMNIPAGLAIGADEFAQAAVEGALLARWTFYLGVAQQRGGLVSLALVASDADLDRAGEGARRGRVLARAAALARDLANSPAATLTATRIGEIAEQLGAETGLQVEVFDKDQLVQMQCGGLLGVNSGSVEPPRMIRLRYEPDEPTGRLALVGKGIMYDAGGISLKPSDESHSQMKNDMTGAGAVLAAMTALRDLGCRTAVVGYLMCTDNMPSGSALRLGDVLKMRNGKTVEVLNTDAEGRLVMADALVLATEEPIDAVVNIATLTGQCLRTLGTEVAGVMGNNPGVVAQAVAAGATVDEPLWELPLLRSYRTQLASTVADMTNMGGPNAGSITAALFLEEFVDGHPWAHLDIAGTAQAAADRTWRNKGATGTGARTLIELALRFSKPAADTATPDGAIRS
ncbi:MAG: leucyl aminopeptidase [Intrasporangium sp.]|uniref:leucyl aminopeptidase family protein n=1 Tax=Intrasporangium sp. TaxID=1925024 RepID=UPI0026488054|nr:M17 family peptidase N-terminal domain-containing protein [Intrasporangium sp.]MDN5796847.1 leucyl aminopeptidase [Intrasporangium sp.]